MADAASAVVTNSRRVTLRGIRQLVLSQSERQSIHQTHVTLIAFRVSWCISWISCSSILFALRAHCGLDGHPNRAARTRTRCLRSQLRPARYRRWGRTVSDELASRPCPGVYEIFEYEDDNFGDRAPSIIVCNYYFCIMLYSGRKLKRIRRS